MMRLGPGLYDSWNDDYYALVKEDADFHMNDGWYADSNEWNSFNDWFARKLVSPDKRPISDADIVAPADSTPQGIWKIDLNSQIDMGVQLKSVRFYSVRHLIGEGSAYQDAFAGGTLTHTFLDVNDYHRYHFPVSGTILEVRKIPSLDAEGGIISCNWEESVKPGAVVHAGDPMGYFLFGGSDIVMVFQKEEGVSLKLLTNNHILMGEPYAIID